MIQKYLCISIFVFSSLNASLSENLKRTFYDACYHKPKHALHILQIYKSNPDAQAELANYTIVDGYYQPLIWAVQFRYLDLIKALLEAKADPNTTGLYGNTPLHYACYHKDFEVISLLVCFGKNLNLTQLNHKQKTPLDLIKKDTDTFVELESFFALVTEQPEKQHSYARFFRAPSPFERRSRKDKLSSSDTHTSPHAVHRSKTPFETMF